MNTPQTGPILRTVGLAALCAVHAFGQQVEPLNDPLDGTFRDSETTLDPDVSG